MLSEHDPPFVAAVAAASEGRAALPESAMVILAVVEWVVVGLIVGFVASKMVNLRGDDPRLGIFAATGGAVLAAALYTFFSGAGMGAWRPWALVWAAVGAAVGAAAWHMVRSRSISHERYTPRRSY